MNTINIKFACTNSTLLSHTCENNTVRKTLEHALEKGELLAGATFVDADLSNIDFSNKSLVGCRFIRCNLSGANFAGAYLEGSIAESCILPVDSYDIACF